MCKVLSGQGSDCVSIGPEEAQNKALCCTLCSSSARHVTCWTSTILSVLMVQETSSYLASMGHASCHCEG